MLLPDHHAQPAHPAAGLIDALDRNARLRSRLLRLPQMG
jgi:hypothetical protein